jgi:ABC-type phosphate transport system substrate-binding protein
MKFLNRYFLIFTIALFCLYAAVVSAQVVIIANKSISVKSIDMNSLRNLYTLQSNEIGAQKVKLFFLNEDSETDNKFLSNMGKTLLELKKIWLTAKLTGNGIPPEIVVNSAAVVDKITATPGAVGFVDSKSINGNIKVLLKID